ncbi:TetR/AcrR family transcriptional regulator [Allokutzneria sp. A3M-2-11 16]|uniref:TetR/AcrR family transcriptional regulator n=1 Tax=Allokutzneria sp. A3M-2-11 16 TaxID=2962043 RepID=UPI0020B700CD|nr:TetR/AcrR family transcriptional regulator [Allokutzneria sp. A3M-2-11 16]MCP3802416.1 TetR/AcrR family transcriptional regulator [Allokutzneria sp. A3M-2-11 16]
MGDHRSNPRRRGDVLLNAIFEATLAELAESGYANLTMERIAERARTSKASLYRRWPSRADLVAAAAGHALPADDELPDTGDLRRDVLTLLRMIADRFDGPLGAAARGLLAETLHHPELGRELRSRTTSNRERMMRGVLDKAVERGEITPEALTPRVVMAGPSLLQLHFLQYGAPVPDEVIEQITDEVVLPLVTRKGWHRRTGTTPTG